MAQSNLDLGDILNGPNADNGWVISGGGLTVDPADFSVADYYIFDIRSATDFATGHIKDAHNVAFSDILNAAETAGKDKKFLIVCYTGQTAARATGLLRLLGYNVKSLKWGMSSWHEDFAGKWNSNATDFSSPNWVTTGAPPAVKEFDDPSFNTGEVNGEEILKARVQAALSMDWTVSKTDVLANPANYFINNKWSLTSWDAFGHINGAYRIDEDLTLDNLKNLDPDQLLVTYCYTGQTSSITTAWLDVLGYDGRSLLFGANGIVHSNMVGSSVAAKCWKGAGSGSAMNFGYYDGTGSMHDPK
jgi:rhodanese-related sulfurtransferase